MLAKKRLVPVCYNCNPVFNVRNGAAIWAPQALSNQQNGEDSHAL